MNDLVLTSGSTPATSTPGGGVDANADRASIDHHRGDDASAVALRTVPATAEAYDHRGVVANLQAKAPQGVTLPELPSQLVKDFNAWAHGIKLNNEQYESALSEYLAGITGMVEQGFKHAMANGRAELAKVWGAAAHDLTSAPYQAAYRAYMTYAPAAHRNRESMDLIGSHPLVLQILAAIGAELGEDTRTHGEGAAPEDVKQLMQSQPYWNKAHPEHAATVKKVNDFFARGGRVAG